MASSDGGASTDIPPTDAESNLSLSMDWESDDDEFVVGPTCDDDAQDADDSQHVAEAEPEVHHENVGEETAGEGDDEEITEEPKRKRKSRRRKRKRGTKLRTSAVWEPIACGTRNQPGNDTTQGVIPAYPTGKMVFLQWRSMERRWR